MGTSLPAETACRRGEEILLDSEISLLFLRQGDQVNRGQGECILLHPGISLQMFARILFSDLSAWANRRVRVNDTNVLNRHILLDSEISLLFMRQSDKPCLPAAFRHSGRQVG